MGHLGNLKEEYRALVHRLGAGTVALPEPTDPRAWQGWREILEILYSPEEADLASRMPVLPTPLSDVSKRLGIPEPELRPRLDAMCDKGLVLDLVHSRTGETKYLLAPPVVGFFEFSMMRASDGIPKRRMAEALDAYTHFDEAFAREALGTETVIGRSLVHETALDDPPPDTLEWERATSIVREAKTAAVSLCYCRHKAEHLGTRCDAPIDCCLSLDGGAEFVIRRGFGRAVETTEAMEILLRSRESGLVQIADNVQDRPSYICNCCGCCCGQLQAINHFGLHAVNPSGFAPACDEARCKGCSSCSRACPITAISMHARRTEAKRSNGMWPRFDADRCIGCGVCAWACPQKAIRMTRREAPPYVPLNVIEKSIRMCLERGRLADLLFDEGASRGSRFLNQVLKAIVSLPPVQRLLASEQVRSRFVRAALARVSL